MSVIIANRLSKSFGRGQAKTSVLVDATLTVEQGECVTILGPSGSGKSTLLNILGLIDSPDSGELWLQEKAVHELGPAALTEFRRQSIGFVFQQFNLIPVMSVFHNVAYPLMLLGWDASSVRSRVMDVLTQVDLANFKDQKPEQLSGGQCQRVAIARALVKSPTLLIADEPTASLDAQTATSVMESMRTLADSFGTACIIATHDMRLLPFSNRVFNVDQGDVCETSIAAQETFNRAREGALS